MNHVVDEHTIEYDANSHRSKDAARKQNADDKSGSIDTTTTYEYDPRDRIRKQTKTGTGAGTEEYVHDANSNVIEQTVKSLKTTFDYDRNRLKRSETAGIKSTYKYDDWGRHESTTTADEETEKYTYELVPRVLRTRVRMSGHPCGGRGAPNRSTREDLHEHPGHRGSPGSLRAALE